jgi:hypothetical protein
MLREKRPRLRQVHSASKPSCAYSITSSAPAAVSGSHARTRRRTVGSHGRRRDRLLFFLPKIMALVVAVAAAVVAGVAV